MCDNDYVCVHWYVSFKSLNVYEYVSWLNHLMGDSPGDVSEEPVT